MPTVTNLRQIALLAVFAVACAPSAHAGRIYIDFGDGNFDQSGNLFPLADSHDVDVDTDLSAGPIALPFSINIDGTAYTSFFLNENGAITFGSALPEGVFTSVTDLANLGVPVIAPFYTNLASAPADGDDATIIPGQVFYSSGEADPAADSAGAYSLAETVPALRVTWFDVTSASDSTAHVFTQLYLYSQGGGDFDIRFAYGNPDFSGGDVTPALGELIGFVLGSSSAALGAPAPLTGDAFFSFRGGELVGGGTTPVPEPPMEWLATIGLVLVVGGGVARRNRGRRPPA